MNTPKWLFPTIMVLSLIGAPAAWLFFAHWVGVRLTASQDPLGLLVGFAGIIAAVFTVGGLVIALAAVVTLLSVEDRVTRAFSERLPDFEQRANNQIKAHLLLQTSESAALEIAEPLVIEALKLYPGIQQARSSLGLKMADEVIAHFARAHGKVDLFNPGPPLQPFDQGPPLSAAIYWLRSALEHDDHREGKVVVALALMYGADRRYEQMMGAIGQCLKAKPDQLPYLQEPLHVAMLAYACIPREENLQRVGESLSLRGEIPAPLDAVQASLNDAVFTNAGSYVDWYAVGRWGMWDVSDLSRFPVLTRFLMCDDPQGVRQGQAILPSPTLRDLARVFDNTKPSRPVTEVVAELDKYLLFVRQASA